MSTPLNIERFNILTGLILAHAFNTFPHYADITYRNFATDVIDKDDVIGTWSLDHTVEETVVWLERSGYIWFQKQTDAKHGGASITLSPNGFELLKAAPESLETGDSFGDMIKKYAADKSIDLLEKLVPLLLTQGARLITG